MANPGPDVVNATLGAAFGVAFGGILSLICKAIEGVNYVCHCHEECKSLGEYLEIIKPIFEKISNQCPTEEALENWLGVFQKCLEKANEILENCRDGSNWERIREVTYARQILKLKKQLEECVNLSSMVHLMHESISKSNVGTSVLMQEVPQEILGMEDHFKRVK